jgi:hypothetical protein
MCGPNDASIHGNTTASDDAEQRKRNRIALDERRNYMTEAEYQAALAHLNDADKAATDPKGTTNANVANDLKTQGFTITPPPDAPDLTDKLVSARRASQTQSLLTGRGRAYSFLGGGIAGRGPSLLGGY